MGIGRPAIHIMLRLSLSTTCRDRGAATEQAIAAVRYLGVIQCRSSCTTRLFDALCHWDAAWLEN